MMKVQGTHSKSKKMQTHSKRQEKKKVAVNDILYFCYENVWENSFKFVLCFILML